MSPGRVRCHTPLFDLRIVIAGALLGLLAAAPGCGGSESTDGEDIDCTDDEFYDPEHDRCVPKMPGDDTPDGGMDARGNSDATSNRDGGTPSDTSADTGSPDTAPPQDTGPDPMCDKDNDRALAPSCGGNDCDDNDPNRSPKLAERCDTIDNNCSGEVNDGIDCSFYAHEGETLYKVSPFTKEATQVGEDLPGLHDLDTHPDGTLYGVTQDGYYKFDEQTGKWDVLRSFPDNASYVPQDPNGMAIDREGKTYITSKDTLWTITHKPEKSGEKKWWLEKVGTTGTTSSGQKLVSSGDCVIKKRTLFMTSKHDDAEDYLVELSKANGEASDPNPIPLGHSNVFGLTDAWGTLYGLTQDGKLIKIDERSQSTTVVHTFEERRWYGAASTPRRK